MRRALVVQRANLGVRLIVSTVAVGARVQPQVVPQRDLSVEAGLPGRLRVAQEHARCPSAGKGADRTRRIRSAGIESGRTGSTVADGGGDHSLRIHLGRADTVHEVVGDPVAHTILRHAATTRGERLLSAHVDDSVAVAGELGTELPRNATPLKYAEVGAELMPPRLHTSDVHDLAARESDRRRERYVHDRIGHVAAEVRVLDVHASAKERGLEPQLELVAPLRFCLLYTSPSPRDS